MKLIVITAGRSKDKSLIPLINFYAGKLPHYLSAEYIEMPDVRGCSTPEAFKLAEGKAFLDRVKPGDYVMLLDERGKEYTSRQYAALLGDKMSALQGNLIFIIGGAYGFSQAVYDRANAMLALSKMTFTHEMARVLTLEQTYRALTILKGEKYHHD